MRIEWNVGRRALAFALLMLVASVASATIDGRIKSVDWGLSSESVPIVVKPLIVIENTGNEKTRFHVMLAVSDGKRYSGGCEPTAEIDVGKIGIVWPYPLRLANRGDLCCIAVELYSDSCFGSKLLDVKKRWMLRSE
jgi:hypothetical protein